MQHRGATATLGARFQNAPFYVTVSHDPHPLPLSLTGHSFTHIFRDAVHFRFKVTHMAKDGTLHNVDFSLKPVKDDNGKVIFIIPEGRDISESKKAEEGEV